MRRGLVVAVLLCLAGAALVLLATSLPWLSYGVAPGTGFPTRTNDVTGATLAPGTRALALLGLAGVAALAATRDWGRLAVGAVVALAGAGICVVLIQVLADPAAAVLERSPGDVAVTSRLALGGWPYVALLGGLLLLAAGLLTVVRGRSWSALGARYDAPTEPKPPSEASLWDALDRGEDPTAGR